MLASIVIAAVLTQYGPPPPPPPGWYPTRPPPAYYPPPYASPPPPPRPSYAAPADREPASTWYLGMGMGFGGGYSQGVPASPAGMVDGGGLGLAFRTGAVVTPHLLLGVDFSGIHAAGSGPNYGNAGITLINYDAVATVFPLKRGPFIRTGAGLSTLSLPDAGGGSTTHAGTNLLFGLGYALPAAPGLAVTFNLDYSRQLYSARDLDGSSLIFGYVGFQIH